MLKRILFALVCLLIPTALRAQQCTVGGTGAGSVTVSGNLQDLGGVNITAGTTFVRFTLTGYGANIPRVTGTTAIAAPCYDLKPNGSGVIGGTIWGNDKISVGANPAGGTFYIVCTFQSGQPFRCNNFTINGSTFNLNNATPNTTNPTIPAPTGDNTYARKDGGNQPFNLRINQQIFTSSGTFTIPVNVTNIKVTVTGGGGAGGGGLSSANGGGAGAGSGATAIKYLSSLTPGNTLTVTVGPGGTGVNGSAGNAGSQSTVSSGTQTISTITAGGGNGGNNGTASGAPGGTASGGDINLAGNAAEFVIAGTTTNGTGQRSAGSYWGGGVVGGNGQNGVAGNAGGAPGAGGSGGGTGGSATSTGGAGATGIVIFEWVN